jgi:hypothetical protein
MKPDQLSDKEIIDKFNGGMAAVETARVDGLKFLQTLQTVKNRAQVKEHRRLRAKLGDQHPRVQRLASGIRYNAGLAENLTVQIDQSAIDPPAVEEKSWMVHGRVMYQKRKGLAGLTVAIFDAEGRWMRQAGHACTDQHGYFAIVHAPEKNPDDPAQRKMLYFLHVIGPEGRILHKDPDPLNLAIGQIEYREIFLDPDKSLCRPPEAGSGDSDLPSCKE